MITKDELEQLKAYQELYNKVILFSKFRSLIPFGLFLASTYSRSGFPIREGKGGAFPRQISNSFCQNFSYYFCIFRWKEIFFWSCYKSILSGWTSAVLFYLLKKAADPIRKTLSDRVFLPRAFQKIYHCIFSLSEKDLYVVFLSAFLPESLLLYSF
jgi:hypothetical protein